MLIRQQLLIFPKQDSVTYKEYGNPPKLIPEQFGISITLFEDILKSFWSVLKATLTQPSY